MMSFYSFVKEMKGGCFWMYLGGLIDEKYYFVLFFGFLSIEYIYRFYCTYDILGQIKKNHSDSAPNGSHSVDYTHTYFISDLM